MAHFTYGDKTKPPELPELKFILIVDLGQVNWGDFVPHLPELYKQGIIVLRKRRAFWGSGDAIQVFFGSKEEIKGIEELKEILNEIELKEESNHV